MARKVIRQSTESGILSEVNWLPVYWADWMISSSLLERKSYTLVLPVERVSVM